MKSMLPKIETQEQAIAAFRLLLAPLLALRVQKVSPHEGHNHGHNHSKSEKPLKDKEGKKKKKKKKMKSSTKPKHPPHLQSICVQRRSLFRMVLRYHAAADYSGRDWNCYCCVWGNSVSIVASYIENCRMVFVDCVVGFDWGDFGHCNCQIDFFCCYDVCCASWDLAVSESV